MSDISVIITTKNEQDVIERLLISIKKQTFKDFEIIVVDNNSTDQTKEIAKIYSDKIYNKGPERSTQRNLGAKKALGKYLLFLDADMELRPDVLEKSMEEIKRGFAALVIPEKSVAKNFWGKVKALERSFYNTKGDPITDAARFYKKNIFDKVGGYDGSITGPEDWDLPDTLREKGYRIGRVDTLIYHYERISSPLSLARKKFYYGLDAHKYLRKHRISVVGPKTIYFLRPAFYKNLDKLFKNPLLGFGLIIMLTFELIGGGLGFVIGKMRGQK